MYKNSQNNNFNKAQDTTTMTTMILRFLPSFNGLRVVRNSTNRTRSAILFKPTIQTICMNICRTFTRSSILY